MHLGALHGGLVNSRLPAANANVPLLLEHAQQGAHRGIVGPVGERLAHGLCRRGASPPEDFHHLGFTLGPRINAGGRIGRADLGVRLLLEGDISEAARIAAELDRLNTERRVIEQMAEAQAEAEALASLGLDDKGSVIVTGDESIGRFNAEICDDGGHCERSQAQRRFCTRCGAALWLFDPRWPELLHPFASAIDSDLPPPPEKTHIMLRFKASWVEPAIGPSDQSFEEYPEESIEDWHRRHGLWVD